MVIKVKYNGEWVKIPYLSSDHGRELVEEAPKDGSQYARQNGVWSVVNIPEVDFTEVYNAIDTKVDKVEGKGLSTNDYVTADKTKVTNINEVVEAATKNITATDISITLDKRNLVTNVVENIELNLPASTTALAGLMLPSDKTKLNGIAAGAEVNVNADWNATEGDAQILNKPTLATVATSGSYNDLTNKPTIPTVDVTKSYVDTQLATKANASNVYTKSEVDSKVSSVYRVKGSVASYANLPTTNVQIGDVYNVTDTGANYVATATTPTWDKLSETVDLSGYATTAAMNTALGNKVDKVSGKGLSTNDYTTAEKDKLAGIATGANNYSLPVATASVLGGVKTSTGITNSSGTISVAYGSAAGTACQGNDSRLSNSRPASDVSAWAKASTKPTYTWTEITSKPSWIGSSKPTYTASEVGALASGGTAVNASKVANSFIFKVAGGSTEGTNLYTFNGSAAKTINVVAGSNITLTPTSGQLSISAKDTTYGIASASANGLMSSTVYNNLNTQLYVCGYFSQSQAPDYYTIDYEFINPITGEIKYNNKIELRFADTTYSGIMSPVDKRKLDSCPTGSGITEIRSITQSEYDALSTKVATTLYIITG